MRITREEAEALGRRIGAAMRTSPRALPTRKEREIQAAIMDYLRTRSGIYAWRNNVGAVTTGERFVRFGVKGLSDIIGFRRVGDLAQFLAVEVKKPGEHPTQEQAAFLRRVADAGGLAIVARSVDDVARGLGLR